MDSRIINASDLTLNEESIHDTGYSTFHTGSCHATSVLVEVPKIPIVWTQTNIQNFQQELEHRTNLSHPNLCLLLGACLDPQVRIVVEQVKGNIGNELKNTRAPLYQRLTWAKEAAQGISWLHGAAQPVILKELKTTNLFYDEGGKTKVYAWTPFITLSGQNPPEECLIYRAPEILMDKPYGTSADAYSFGLLLYELLTKKKWCQLGNFSNWNDFYQAICVAHQRPPFPENCTSALKSLICECWSPDPQQRPTFTQIAERLEHQIIPQCQSMYFEQRIHVCIPDENARNFWRTFFFKESEVSWDDFCEQFFPIRSDYTQPDYSLPPRKGVSDPLPNLPTDDQLNAATTEQLKELASRNRVGRAIVARALNTRKTSGYVISEQIFTIIDWIYEILCPSNQKVTINSFGSLIGWFGPLDNEFANRVEQAVTNPYFHGKISFEQANRLLQANIQHNPCLVRFSGNTKNAFCICYIAPGPKIKHLPVTYQAGHGFLYKNQHLQSLQDLIDNAQTDLHFGGPCPGSPFERFSDSNLHLYTVLTQ